MYEELYTNITDEQRAIRDMAHRFAKEVLRPAANELDKLKAEEVVKSETYWNAMKQAYELGFHKILIPEIYGGLGLDPLSVHIVLEELGWGSSGLAVSIIVSCFPAVACCIFAGDNDNLIKEFVLPFTEDTKATYIGCWGITEPDHGSDWVASDRKTFRGNVVAKKKESFWLINGQKSAWVSNGPIATHCFLFLTIDEHEGIALVNLKDSDGVTKGKPLEKTGQRALPQGEIYFDDVKLPFENMIVEDVEMFQFAHNSNLALANAGMSAMFTGVARAAFEEALRYSKERFQGGKLIINHQTVQQILFKMYQRVETARYFSRAAMIYNLSNFPPKEEYSIIAKVHATEAAYENANDAIQIFGAMGLTKETEIEMIWRDARASLIEDGSNETLSLKAAACFEDLDIS